MQVLLLGNGFDLHYKFPTRYINFLNTIDYIANNTLFDVKTVGDIFGSEKLWKTDKYIAESYEIHQKYYHATTIPSGILERFTVFAENNMWFSYLWKSFNKDIGWIDFESQINAVITAFKDFLEEPASLFNIHEYPKQELSRHIISQFDFFLEHQSGSMYSIKQEYMIEEPFGSKIYHMNDIKWVGKLKKDLDELTDMLRTYLYYFIEQPVFNIDSSTMKDEWFVKLQPEYVVTFNYTSTFEHFCTSARVAHIHGKVDDQIVLGVNPNEDDEVDTADTMFIEFKKYLQRIILGTDTEYRLISDELNDGANDLILTVMGHSLDITDEDIIRELFDYASDIAIVYHSPNALKDYIAKLIVLYGKDEFDTMRREKNLQFISIETGLDKYVQTVRERESVHLFMSGMR